MKCWSRLIPAAMLLMASAACAPPSTGQHAPHTPEAPNRTAARDTTDEAARPRHTDADVSFVQGMIPHHAQALTMTALVPGRTESRAIHLIAQRIEVSQQDEIAWMQGWLRDRHAEVPGLHGHHHGAGQPLMPGMLTEEELARLSAADGAEFDRLFLEYMIRHHEGALTMVRELFATPGAGQEPEIYRFASDVAVDQQSEIRRMRTLLDEPPEGAPRR